LIQRENGPDAGQRVDMHVSDEQRERELEVRVAARTEELSSLSTHLLRLAETERSSLAKELHDELGGLITAVKMDLSWLSARLGASLDAESRQKLDSVMQMLNQAMMLKRRVVESLRPSLLDHFGLPVALRSHLDENCSRAGLEYIATLNELHQKRRWYNAATTNCTTSIRTQHASDQRQKWDWRMLVNGKGDEMLYERRDIVTGGLSFADLKKQAHINAVAQAADAAPDFSTRIRAGRVGFLRSGHAII